MKTRGRFLENSPSGIYPRKRLQWEEIANHMIERLIFMSTARKKPPVTSRPKQKETINKKALIWIGVAFGIIVVVMALLLSLDV
jgi:hypothetical protein